VIPGQTTEVSTAVNANADSDEDVPQDASLPRGFRFDASGRETLRALSRWLSIDGYASLVTAVAALISLLFAHGLLSSAIRVVIAAANALIGAMFLGVGRAFRGASGGPDSEHEFVMAGLRKLETYYSIHRILLVVLVALTVLGFVLALVTIVRSVS
jgi:hypothetical protein